jgi:hypothetical protein
LDVGGSVRVGGRRIAVALQAFSLTAKDGDAVSFGANLGNVPTVEFDTSALPTLASGQSYDVKALNLTPSGFTMRAKIVTLGTSSTVTSSNGVSTSGTPLWKLHKIDAADASDGKYTFKVTGTAMGIGNSLEPGWAEVQFGCYVRSGGVWTKIGSIANSTQVTSNGTVTLTATGTLTFTGVIGLTTDYEFGAHLEIGNSISAFNSVVYQKVASTTGETSVSQTIPVRIVPQNS